MPHSSWEECVCFCGWGKEILEKVNGGVVSTDCASVERYGKTFAGISILSNKRERG